MKAISVVLVILFLISGALFVLYQSNSYNANIVRFQSYANHPMVKTYDAVVKSLGSETPQSPSGRKNTNQRVDMGECRPVYGKVGVFVAYWQNRTQYRTAIDSLHCYIKTTNYTLFEVDMNTDKETLEYCSEYKEPLFRRQCAVMVYSQKVDWLLVLDGDTAVINPNHCIEEYIDPTVDLLFYERFFNFEFNAGNYLVRYSKFTLDFLLSWAEYDKEYSKIAAEGRKWFSNIDNGALHILLAKTLRPAAKPEIEYCDNIRLSISDLNQYFGYVTCVRWILGAQRVFEGKIKLFRKAQSFVRDAWSTTFGFCELDFMYHDFKETNIHDGVFMKKGFNVSECGVKYSGWHYNPRQRIECDELKKSLIAQEEHFRQYWYPRPSKVYHFLKYREISQCWPNCETK